MFVKRLVFFGIIIISLFIINNLGHSIYGLWQKKTVIMKAEQELNQQTKENLELKTKLAVVKKPQFVEEEARNRLFLAKPGEGIVLIPSKALETKNVSRLTSSDVRPNWQKWWELFFEEKK
jgi:cell division protein FtsB